MPMVLQNIRNAVRNRGGGLLTPTDETLAKAASRLRYGQIALLVYGNPHLGDFDHEYVICVGDDKVVVGNVTRHSAGQYPLLKWFDGGFPQVCHQPKLDDDGTVGALKPVEHADPEAYAEQTLREWWERFVEGAPTFIPRPDISQPMLRGAFPISARDVRTAAWLLNEFPHEMQGDRQDLKRVGGGTNGNSQLIIVTGYGEDHCGGVYSYHAMGGSGIVAVGYTPDPTLVKVRRILTGPQHRKAHLLLAEVLRNGQELIGPVFPSDVGI